MVTPLKELIEHWAADRRLPWAYPVPPSAGGRVCFALLRDESISGVVTVIRIGENPASYHIETCRGNIILDETWASDRTLPACLNDSLRMIRSRTTEEGGTWALAGEES